MKPTPLNLMLNLAAKKTPKKTTTQLAKEIGVSQQTISRWLKQMQSDGLVEKTPSGVRLTNAAVQMLKKMNEATGAQAHDASGRVVEIHGIVTEGLKDGAYYMSLDGYKRQIRQKLGFNAYPGTLNLRVAGKTDLENNQKLQKAKGIEIEGFKDERQHRVYGGASCFKAKINDTAQGAVLIPKRTHHDAHTLEIISPEFLRMALGLKNGSHAKITVLLENE